MYADVELSEGSLSQKPRVGGFRYRRFPIWDHLPVIAEFPKTAKHRVVFSHKPPKRKTKVTPPVPLCRTMCFHLSRAHPLCIDSVTQRG